MDALTGLRGVCAIWIMVFHCLFFSDLHWDIEGSAVMPLFLMLSGFTLAIVYGRHKYKRVNLKFIEFDDEDDASAATSNDAMFHPVNSSDPENGEEVGKVEVRSMEIGKFFQNRAARILPVYYLTTLLAIPYTLGGFGTMPAKDTFAPLTIITNVVPINTLFSFTIGAPYLGTAWTVATLCVFWFFFPYLLTTYQRYSDEDLLKKITFMYYLQFVIVFVGFAGGYMLTDNFFVAFCTGTMNPIGRLPLFIMGICAGLLCGRHPARGTVTTGASVATTEDTLPWSHAWLSTFPGSDLIKDDWRTISRDMSLYLLFTFLVWAAVTSFVVELFGAIILQALVPFAQLTVIVALTRDCSEGNTAFQFLTHWLTQWLGRISMTIYLVHYLFITYLEWYVYHWKVLPYCNFYDEDADCDEQANALVMPTWGIPAVIVLSMIAAPVIFYGFEEPVRKLLQVQKK